MARWPFPLGLVGILMMIGSLFLPVWVVHDLHPPQSEDGFVNLFAVEAPRNVYLGSFPVVIVAAFACMAFATLVAVFAQLKQAWAPATIWLFFLTFACVMLNLRPYGGEWPETAPNFSAWLAAFGGGTSVLVASIAEQGRRMRVATAWLTWPGLALMCASLFLPLWVQLDAALEPWPADSFHIGYVAAWNAGESAGPLALKVAGIGLVLAAAVVALGRPKFAWMPAGLWLVGIACGLFGIHGHVWDAQPYYSPRDRLVPWGWLAAGIGGGCVFLGSLRACRARPHTDVSTFD